MANPTIAAGYPKALLEFAAARGADRQTLLARSQLRPEDLKDQDNRIPLANYLALVKAGIELTGEPALALLFGEAVMLPDISIVGLIGMTVETVEEGQRQINRYARLTLDEDDGRTSDRLELIREGDKVWLKATSEAYVNHPLLTESGFARSVCGARTLARSKLGATNWPYPKAIHFTHAEPSYRAEYDRIFGVPIVFGSHMNALLMDKAFLSIRLPPANRYVFGLLSARAEELLKSLENSKSVRGRVESLLMPVLHTGEASMEMIAGELGISRQTLFRRLKAEGVTFEQVLDELRHKLALHYLSGKKVSVNETAYLVGFSDPASFSRAFKRWTGASPRMMRAAKVKDEQTGLYKSPTLQ
ncbi:MAG TPA: AraC family transcriptional regulator [Pyrinomonadaceae bacterium]|nr:AraC family transcriptional regulator [Pyrinomonadaceae bacterium]